MAVPQCELAIITVCGISIQLAHHNNLHRPFHINRYSLCHTRAYNRVSDQTSDRIAERLLVSARHRSMGSASVLDIRIVLRSVEPRAVN